MLMILKEDKYATLKRKDEQKEREVGLEQDEFFTKRWSQDLFLAIIIKSIFAKPIVRHN